jgi:hypothetical protein
MRAVMLLTAVVLSACASHPTRPNSGGTPAQSSTSAAALPGASDTDPEEQRLALAKKLHLKVVNQDGEEAYCNDLDQLFKPYAPAGQGALTPGRTK